MKKLHTWNEKYQFFCSDCRHFINETTPNTLSLGMGLWCFTTLYISCVIKPRLRGSCVATYVQGAILNLPHTYLRSTYFLIQMYICGWMDGRMDRELGWMDDWNGYAFTNDVYMQEHIQAHGIILQKLTEGFCINQTKRGRLHCYSNFLTILSCFMLRLHFKQCMQIILISARWTTILSRLYFNDSQLKYNSSLKVCCLHVFVRKEKKIIEGKGKRNKER